MNPEPNQSETRDVPPPMSEASVVARNQNEETKNSVTSAREVIEVALKRLKETQKICLDALKSE